MHCPELHVANEARGDKGDAGGVGRFPNFTVPSAGWETLAGVSLPMLDGKIVSQRPPRVTHRVYRGNPTKSQQIPLNVAEDIRKPEFGPRMNTDETWIRGKARLTSSVSIRVHPWLIFLPSTTAGRGRQFFDETLQRRSDQIRLVPGSPTGGLSA